ncbi:tRNA (adenine-N1)-methyltransferase [Nocardioides sp. TRM66260-LWL]|uniref:tRNA (adenine-N1)-methyltransferase n=1 Tax=Nocardioides sp. TRM66260-LWL TaxID=2874478 RepID=UPI001CC82B8A|nr:tRNA (adenine-N1)-methyltransferase [Nocardioides sp. TRM66260-LWL]MBZ5733967.1 tRNA (adenine-N1)-methyltransferase [Nocardioides sp. TRM66260-LWL]
MSSASDPVEPAPPVELGDVPPEAWSGVHRGPLRAGEWIRLVDAKGRKHNFALTPGKRFFSNRGHLEHDELIGCEEGFTVQSSGGAEYLVFRPLLSEFVVSMPRGAAVVYPKDAAQIVALADVFPGARVVEAGVGSGALTCSLLRAVGPYGRVSSFERREEFAEVARRNVDQFFGVPEGAAHPSWTLTLGDLAEALPASGERADRIILDMLAPWECLGAAADALVPGGIVCAYVATTTQLSRFVETVRVHGGFTEPHAWESLVRDWHVEGLAVRPGHKMIGHTAFLVTARRLAPGARPPRRTRRPAPGAYGVDYTGPRPADVAHEGPEVELDAPASSTGPDGDATES